MEEEPCKPPLEKSHAWGRWIGLVIAIVVLIAAAIPGFLKARVPSRHSCQEEMTKVDSGVQQYMLEHDLHSQAEFVALWGTEQETWSEALVGPDKYIRYAPRCPHPEPDPFWKFWATSDYSIAPDDSGFEDGAPVKCNVNPRHVYLRWGS